MPDFLRPRGDRKDVQVGGMDGDPPDVPVSPPTLLQPGEVRSSERRRKAGGEPELARQDLGAFGEHVASVLAAAEAAAAKLLAEAEQHANDTRQEASQIAEDIRTRANEEEQLQRAAARRVVEDAEASAGTIKSDSDRYADERRREADTRAAKLIRDAERHAATIADASRERHGILLANIAASETRLRELAENLRLVASSLDDVVGNAAPGDEPAARQVHHHEDAESLHESLQQRVQRGQPVEDKSER